MGNEKMRKVALATCFLDNYGACLQAYGLQSVISEMGYCCEVLAYIEPAGYLRPSRRYNLSIRIRQIVSLPLSVLMKKYRYPIPYYKRVQVILDKRKAFDRFKMRCLNFRRDEKNRVRYYESFGALDAEDLHYDAFVCGSDQIWNPTFYGKNNPAYFLRFAPQQKRIAYSPSIGLPAMPDKYREEFIRFVREIPSVSVREQTAAQIIRDTCGRDVPVTMDPTLLAGRAFWLKAVESQKNTCSFSKYILCYFFSNTERMKSYIEQVHAQTGLPIVYFATTELTFDPAYSYCAAGAGPLEFLQLILDAQIVLTDSFHGTVFSLLYQKSFYVLQRERLGGEVNMFSRLNDLLGRLELNDRVLSYEQQVPVSQTPIDYGKVAARLDAWRAQSAQYLKDALEEACHGNC